MRSIRFLALILALGFVSACSDLGPTAVEDGCDENGAVACEGYIGSDT
jgi:hypothetical protein